MSIPSPSWKIKAKSHRAAQLNFIPPSWRLPLIPQSDTIHDPRPLITSSSILSPLDLEITSTVSAQTILTNLHSRHWSSEQVTTAFCKRAAVAHQLIKCCTELMFDDAIARAKELDAHLERTGEVVGPLHGLPISLKDGHEIQGYDVTLGWVGLIGKPALLDGVLVKDIRRMGCVVYVKTNVPQSLMMSDSYNHVWGQSVNGWNGGLISGGSSGGEGALVGVGGSVLGVGTDIGGSVRIPAGLQGLYGLCPSTGRVGNRESGRHQKYVVPPVSGPISGGLEGVKVFMEGYLSGEPWRRDPGIVPLPWRGGMVTEVVEKGKLRIGFVVDDGVVLPQPPVQRVMKEMLEKLKKGGHEVIQWDCSSHKDAYYDLWLKAVLADGGKRCEDLCKLVDEPLIEGMLVGTPDTALDNMQRQELAEKIWDYQKKYLDRWEESGVDALIMPILPWVGMRPKTWVKSRQYCGYTAIWNLLNYTALAIPGSIALQHLDRPDETWTGHEGRSFSDQFNHDQYDIDLVDGMPVGLQIITGRLEEEKAVGVAKVIESLSR